MSPDDGPLRLLREAVRDAAHEAAYHWRRNDWTLRPSSYLSDFEDVPVHRPILGLGLDGGGTTLLGRMIRRHPDVVTCTGDASYWAGPSELHTVLGPLLPPELTGLRWKPPAPDHPLYEPPRSWTYACDELLPRYRETAEDATPELREALLRVLRMSLARHAADPSTARFFDKSQVYTVRLGLLRALMDGTDPRFYLLLMDPWVACYKAALGRVDDMDRLRDALTLEERLEVCAQHWANCVEAALEDGEDVLHVLRFEDLLEDPAKRLRALCDHLDLAFHEDMVPGPDDEMPIGSRYRDRWHPLEPDRVRRYRDELVAEMGEEGVGIVADRCADLARRFDYHPPET